MAEEKKNSGGQFASQAVPIDQRMKTPALFGAMSGFVFMTTSLQAGANMGFGADFATVLKAIAVGAVFLTVITCIMAAAAAKTGLTFGQLTAYAYGRHGSKVIGCIMAFSLLGWTAVDAGLMAGAINATIPQIPFLPMSLVCVVLFTATAAFGMKAMSKLGTICIPVIGIFGIISMSLGIRRVGGLDGLMCYIPLPTAELQFTTLVGLAIGSWIGCACSLLPDFMRFAKTPKVAVGLTILFMAVINPLMLVIGAVGAIATGQGDMPYVLAAQGLAIPGLLIGIFGNWGPAQGNEYSCALTWGNIFKLEHKKITVICGAVALLLTAMDFFQYFGAFLIFLSNCVPAIIGVFIADFLYTYRKGYPPTEQIAFNVDQRGVAAVIVGIVLAYVGLPGISQVWCVCGAVLVRIVLNQMGNDSPSKLYHTENIENF
ncbi:MAG: hypothetical protein HFG22_06815 [Lachnospiraceae bacterium]|nr:hypothetical protein [Lachnospiraceae bacterium]